MKPSQQKSGTAVKRISRCETPATQARKAAGLSLDEAARRARIGSRYLQRIEKTGNASWVLAERLAQLYGCSPVLFLQGR